MHICHRGAENTKTFYKGFLCVLCASVANMHVILLKHLTLSNYFSIGNSVILRLVQP